MKRTKIIGGGLAGCEAAYQLLKRGRAVTMYEMRPFTQTPIHKTALLAELVCSNSLKSCDENTAQGLLKAELNMLDSLVLRAARNNAVAAGGALAVEREEFSREIEKTLSEFDNFTLIREERVDIEEDTIVASGPLTSDKLAENIDKLLGGDRLFFFDAVAPIVTYESVDMTKAYFQGRYGKGGDDYLNCPLTKEEYYYFVDELKKAERAIPHNFEKGDTFNACMPLEVMAQKGSESLRFGPFRPVGLRNPDGSRPYAVLQLRKEDNYNQLYNLVGCQTNLKFGEQKRVFALVPALASAEFVRYGVMHRNTFINSPESLSSDFSLKTNGKIFFAGQISGVEGYLESCMSGLFSGINMSRKFDGLDSLVPNEYTACGSLMKYISSPQKNFQPMHVGFPLMPPFEEKIKDKTLRKSALSQRAKQNMKEYISQIER